MKEKKLIAPNECSLPRWILVVAASLSVAFIPIFFMSPYLENRVDTFMGITYADIFTVLTFVPLFATTVLFMKLIGKTSVKDFVLGVGGRFDKKSFFIPLGLYALGFAIPYLLNIGNIRPRAVDPAQYAFLLAFALLFTWIQTTWEEFIFRGIFLRWACKNNVSYTKKAVWAAVISSLLFTLAHALNPEVLDQNGIQILLQLISYFIPGFMMFIANVHFGNLLPGIVIHWFNNFTLFTVISAEINAVSMPTLFIDATPDHANWALISTVIAYLPLAIYIVVDLIKSKNSAPKSAE